MYFKQAKLFFDNITLYVNQCKTNDINLAQRNHYGVPEAIYILHP